ncbi:hypothetical protein BU24DRAFT_459954 [Aaosphaeria arxii CBS 175.79]|uniref:BZIP domain-containing protein n=1 Tax=Aaosphaeria arxii CBS 175.79 TaxID=1450172 RepID=A0A6A5XUF2_9PLEO|nr:uncharacterized protein BU24DRAFT_459954 [Aaosphaeria arxii CBS 175.79]KAF2016832.1 hypothetical protein BU24DRAFT_459954 [Aaosphaeria arxii CBS 175.79]
MPPRLPEAWDETDDWTEVTDAKERRRRQNRLHQRVHRRKRHIKALASTQASDAVANDASATLLPIYSTDDRTNQAHASVQNMSIFYLLRCPGLQAQAREFLKKAAVDWIISMPIPKDLPTLTRLNAFNVLARNAQILHIPVECLESDEDDSPLFRLDSDSREPTLALPTSLSPTALQQTIKHHPWLDLFPFPKLRDNILLALQGGQHDEEEMIHELVCDFLNLSATGSAVLIIWGDCWDENGWEFSSEFFDRWRDLLDGCSDILQVTNAWRAKRGALPLDYILN